MAEHMRNYGKGMFVGHLPKKYHYDKRFPKPLAVMSWTNMFNKNIQQGMYKSAAAQRKELDVFKAPDGFHAEVYEVPVKGSSIRM